MTLSDCRVLIVDDHAHNRALLAALLEGLSITLVEQAANGIEGLEKVARRRPDLILLDVMMPGMDGYEMCRKLRQTYSHSDLPVIFVTALDSPDERSACFAAGGTDMVAKPINGPEIASRVGVHLENRILLDRLRAFQERLSLELEAARAIQENLTPGQAELNRVGAATGTVIQAHAETSSELGGDFWSVRDDGDGHVVVLLADFAGHGVAPALNVIRLHTLFGRIAAAAAPHEAMVALNAELKALLPVGQYATALYGIFDARRGRFSFAGAAAPPFWIVQNGQARYIEASGPPLGAFQDAEYETQTVEIGPDAQLFLHSDALMESQVDGADIADEQVLAAWLVEDAGTGSLPQALAARFHRLLPGPPPDDLTMISIGAR
ncbi:MAG: fused response regulator/phosphatase [Alphaproteobacteria bacterium]|nr:fused response regulator/phosphatase [Alphaproteobacteria bacterium]